MDLPPVDVTVETGPSEAAQIDIPSTPAVPLGDNNFSFISPIENAAPSPRDGLFTGSDDEDDMQLNRRNHLESGQYASRVQALLTLLNDLHDLRVTQFQLSIPSVAVIGNQSSGKSSLIESICGISVPRDSGTCTRCPMRCEIRKPDITSNDHHSWSAKISIEVEDKVTQTTRFVPFGPTVITNPREVELWILRAQAAILNPNVKSSTFERLSKGAILAWRNQNSHNSGGDAMFISEKLLKVTIEYEDATPLTFIDLPGIVHNVPRGVPRDMPHTVRRLVKKNIEPIDTIILVTIPALDDIETQEAFQIAREADSPNVRTLGVFTKPDLLSDSSTNLIRRRREDIDGLYASEGSLGFFAVKLPDDSERSLSPSALEAVEATLFSTKAPWDRVRKRERLGLKNLVSHVGNLLADLIDARLPFLRREVASGLKETEDEVNRLPPEQDWSKMRREVKLHLLLTTFCQAVRTTVLASDSHSNEYMSFVQGNIEVYKNFAEEIKATQPQYANSPSNHVNYVEGVITSCKSWELPGDVPYLALKTLIVAFTAQWEHPAQACFRSVAQKFLSYIRDTLIPKYFDDFPTLKQYTSDAVQASFEERMLIAGDRVRAKWYLEGAVPFYTLMQEEYSQAVTTWGDQLYNNNLRYVNSNRQDPKLLLMAKALAYYDISSKRFIDYIMLTVESELNDTFSESLHTTLLDSITSPKAPTVEDLMAEDMDVQKQRANLREKRVALEGILRRLDEHDPDLATRELPPTGTRSPSPSPIPFQF